MMLRSEPASYRDHRARIVYADGEVYRVILDAGAEGYRKVRQVLDRLVAKGLLLACDEVEAAPFATLGAVHAVRHPKLPLVTYPYEWSFEMLRAAALLHLDLHLEALEAGATLTDGSAYNVQFVGTRPVFIDCTSIVPYEPDAYWDGYGQFCDQFLGPLLLASHGRVPFQRWYRGMPEGLPPEWVERALPLASRLRPAVFLNIGLNAAGRRRVSGTAQAPKKALPLPGLRWLLKGLRRQIEGLRAPPPAVAPIVEYGRNSPHAAAYQVAKQDAVSRFVAEVKPATLIDLGCNTGTYSQLTARAGAGFVVGLDGDPWAIDEAFSTARQEGRNVLPLVADLADPSPGQGWRGAERRALTERLEGDAILALALIHHLCLTRKLPLAEVVAWLVRIAPVGLIEFVPRDDPFAMTLHGASLPSSDYSVEGFQRELGKHAAILGQEILPSSTRQLYRYRRS